MKNILIALAAASVAFGAPALAQLGAADSDRNVYFDAFCGEYGNDCKVYFRGTRMSVDNSAGIDGSQIDRWTYDCAGACGKIWGKDWWEVTLYYTDFGEKKMAKFMFHERPQAEYFGQYIDSIKRNPSGSDWKELFDY